MKFNSEESNILETFVGRTQELNTIHSWLINKNSLPVFVLGPRGVGKTALCKAYSKIYQDFYSDIAFIGSSQLYNPSSCSSSSGFGLMY